MIIQYSIKLYFKIKICIAADAMLKLVAELNLVISTSISNTAIPGIKSPHQSS